TGHQGGQLLHQPHASGAVHPFEQQFGAALAALTAAERVEERRVVELRVLSSSGERRLARARLAAWLHVVTIQLVLVQHAKHRPTTGAAELLVEASVEVRA